MKMASSQKYFWFIGLWFAGVLSVTVVGLIVRLFLAP